MADTKSRQQLAVVFGFLLAVLLAMHPKLALAHAVLVSSTPQKNAAVSGPDITFSLKYNSRVDGAHSSLSLLKPDGSIERIQALSQPAADMLTASGHKLSKGAYVLRWQVLSSDGHITRGEVPFQVQ
jgi:methionine-rich copper-binding protein CopC